MPSSLFNKTSKFDSIPNSEEFDAEEAKQLLENNLDPESSSLLDNLYQHIIDYVIKTNDKELYKQAKKIFMKQGKLSRPKFAFTLAQAYAEKAGFDLSSKQKLKLRDWSLVIEVIHNSSLLQDDIIDHASHRRGEQTNHIIYGRDTTAVLPLFLVGRGGQLINSLEVEGLYKIYAQAIYDLPAGEQLQKQFRKSFLADTDPNIEEIMKSYLNKSYYKTGSLFTGLIRGTAKILGASPEEELELFKVGVSIGTAFQVSDDLLDIMQSPLINDDLPSEEVEKDKLNDLSEMNFTAPYLLTLFEYQGTAEGDLFLEILKNPERSQSDYQTIARMFTESNAEKRSAYLADYQLKLGLNSLDQFCLKGSPQGDALKAFATSLVYRNR